MLPKTADIVVIGGGIVGMSIAYHLVKAGVKNVLLLEKALSFGEGSSGRSAGGIRRLFSNADDIKLAQRSLEMIQVFTREFGKDFDPDFRQHGYLFLAANQPLYDQYKKDAELQQGLGVPSKLLKPHEIRDVAPQLETSDLLGALYCGEDGYFDPWPVIEGYYTRGRVMGLRALVGQEVKAVEVKGGAIKSVTTPEGTIETPVVVNAAGPWANEIGKMIGIDHGLKPRLRQIFVTHPLPEGTLSPDCPLVLDLSLPFYFRPEGSGMILSAAEEWERPLDQDWVDDKSLEHITKCLMQRAPSLADCGIMNSWAGFRTLNETGSAFVGPHEDIDGYYTAIGFCGHGVMHAPAIGEYLAQTISA